MNFNKNPNRNSRRTDYNPLEHRKKAKEIIFSFDDIDIRRPTYLAPTLPSKEEFKLELIDIPNTFSQQNPL